LNEFERAKKSVEYLALDVSLDELQRTFSKIPLKGYTYVKCRGLHGTYDDALAWLLKPENRHNPTCILSMGSSIGNFTRREAADFLRGFSKVLGPSDSMLIGLDSCKDPDKVFKAYNDSKGITRKFYLNGLSHANSILGFEAFKPEDWDVIGMYNEASGCHEAYYSPQKDISLDGLLLKKGEKILFEQAFKYGSEEFETLWHGADLIPTSSFGNTLGDYCKNRCSTLDPSWQLMALIFLREFSTYKC
jgi:EasF-like predicted methyltransferase